MSITMLTIDDELNLVRRQLNDLVRYRTTSGLIPSEELRYRSLCQSERFLLLARDAREGVSR
jgi:hypothetical protein